MIPNQISPDSLHPPVIAGVPTGGENRGIFNPMKPSAYLKERIRSGEMSALELLRLAASETEDADLRCLLDGTAKFIERQGIQIVKALEAMVAAQLTQKVA